MLGVQLDLYSSFLVAPSNEKPLGRAGSVYAILALG